ncbi:MAG: EFR1 family ferrodoxin [Desulfobacterales bacterium]|nr:EFR1 family ferrodoxin [Desulfobacterales bacterium]
MVFHEAILYVASGTGNTRAVGNWACAILENSGIAARSAMIDSCDPHAQIRPSQQVLMGILFPTHGFLPPWSMIKFLFRLPRKRGASAFCAATRGGLRFGSVQIPGAAGFGPFLAALVLGFKGYRVRGVFSLDMPSNFINFHWGLHRKNVDAISQRARRCLETPMARLVSGERVFLTRNNLWEALWTVGMFWAIPLFPIFYLIFGRLFMAKMLFSCDRCVGCGLCAAACPNHAIVMKTVGGDKKRPFWTWRCETCMRCMGYCPTRAVEAGHSWAILLYFIVSVPVGAWLVAKLSGAIPGFPNVRNYWTLELVNVVYFYPAMIIAYRVFWSLLRVPLLRSFFTRTTLTHYYRRYHHPEIPRKSLASARPRRRSR